MFLGIEQLSFGTTELRSCASITLIVRIALCRIRQSVDARRLTFDGWRTSTAVPAMGRRDARDWTRFGQDRVRI